MEMNEKVFNSMSDEEKKTYLEKSADTFEKIGDALDNLAKSSNQAQDAIVNAWANLSRAMGGKKKVGTGIRSKAPRNIASRKPVKR